MIPSLRAGRQTLCMKISTITIGIEVETVVKAQNPRDEGGVTSFFEELEGIFLLFQNNSV